jgi:hypothetical protein
VERNRTKIAIDSLNFTDVTPDRSPGDFVHRLAVRELAAYVSERPSGVAGENR